MARDGDLDLKRELLEQLRELKRIRKQSVRKGRPDLATGATAQMVQIAKMLADLEEARNEAKPSEVRWKITYEDGTPFGETDETATAQNANPYTSAVREALGFRQPLPSIRADMGRLDLAAQLDHQSQRETGKTALAMRILAKVLRNELSLAEELNHETIRGLQNKSGSEVGRGDGQARGNNRS